MSQAEIYNILKESHEPLSLRELSQRIEIALENISRQIQALLKHNEISFLDLTNDETREYCQKKGLVSPKRRMRIYFVSSDLAG